MEEAFEDRRTRLSKLSEATVIPISLVIVLIGATVYVTSIFGQTSAQRERLDKIEKNQEDYNKSVQVIAERLATIEGLLRGKDGSK